MTPADAPAPLASPPTSPTTTPRAVELVLGKLGPGWRHTVTHGVGAVVKHPTDPDTRKQVEVHVGVRSTALRLRHLDGRAAVAIWVAAWTPDAWTERKATKTLGARSVLTPAHWRYSFEQALAWQVCVDQQCPRAGVEHPAGIPQRLNAAELGAYVAAPTVTVEGGEVLALFPDIERAVA